MCVCMRTYLLTHIIHAQVFAEADACRVFLFEQTHDVLVLLKRSTNGDLVKKTLPPHGVSGTTYIHTYVDTYIHTWIHTYIL